MECITNTKSTKHIQTNEVPLTLTRLTMIHSEHSELNDRNSFVHNWLNNSNNNCESETSTSTFETVKTMEKASVSTSKVAPTTSIQYKEQEIDDDMRITFPSTIRRNQGPYLFEEDRKIVKYIWKHNLAPFVHGNTIWKDLADENIVSGRSWQSLKNRFFKQIMAQSIYKKILNPSAHEKFWNDVTYSGNAKKSMASSSSQQRKRITRSSSLADSDDNGNYEKRKKVDDNLKINNNPKPTKQNETQQTVQAQSIVDNTNEIIVVEEVDYSKIIEPPSSTIQIQNDSEKEKQDSLEKKLQLELAEIEEEISKVSKSLQKNPSHPFSTNNIVVIADNNKNLNQDLVNISSPSSTVNTNAGNSNNVRSNNQILPNFDTEISAPESRTATDSNTNIVDTSFTTDFETCLTEIAISTDQPATKILENVTSTSEVVEIYNNTILTATNLSNIDSTNLSINERSNSISEVASNSNNIASNTQLAADTSFSTDFETCLSETVIPTDLQNLSENVSVPQAVSISNNIVSDINIETEKPTQNETQNLSEDTNFDSSPEIVPNSDKIVSNIISSETEMSIQNLTQNLLENVSSVVPNSINIVSNKNSETRMLINTVAANLSENINFDSTLAAVPNNNNTALNSSSRTEISIINVIASSLTNVNSDATPNSHYNTTDSNLGTEIPINRKLSENKNILDSIQTTDFNLTNTTTYDSEFATSNTKSVGCSTQILTNEDLSNTNSVNTNMISNSLATNQMNSNTNTENTFLKSSCSSKSESLKRKCYHIISSTNNEEKLVHEIKRLNTLELNEKERSVKNKVDRIIPCNFKDIEAHTVHKIKRPNASQMYNIRTQSSIKNKSDCMMPYTCTDNEAHIVNKIKRPNIVQITDDETGYSIDNFQSENSIKTKDNPIVPSSFRDIEAHTVHNIKRPNIGQLNYETENLLQNKIDDIIPCTPIDNEIETVHGIKRQNEGQIHDKKTGSSIKNKGDNMVPCTFRSQVNDKKTENFAQNNVDRIIPCTVANNTYQTIGEIKRVNEDQIYDNGKQTDTVHKIKRSNIDQINHDETEIFVNNQVDITPCISTNNEIEINGSNTVLGHDKETDPSTSDSSSDKELLSTEQTSNIIHNWRVCHQICQLISQKYLFHIELNEQIYPKQENYKNFTRSIEPYIQYIRTMSPPPSSSTEKNLSIVRNKSNLQTNLKKCAKNVENLDSSTARNDSSKQRYHNANSIDNVENPSNFSFRLKKSELLLQCCQEKKNNAKSKRKLCIESDSSTDDE